MQTVGSDDLVEIRIPRSDDNTLYSIRDNMLFGSGDEQRFTIGEGQHFLIILPVMTNSNTPKRKKATASR